MKELTKKMCLEVLDDDEVDEPTIYYGGLLGLPLGLFPEGIKDGEVFEGFRHIKTKLI